MRKILVANRGEIACRVIRTCKRLGIATVAVYSDADAGSLHVKQADEAVRIGPAPVKDSYLQIETLVEVARKHGAEGVHPGYGLLSERRAFAEAVAAAGITFIGPPPEALDAFGDKLKARAVARSVGVEPPPGSDGPISLADPAALAAEAARIGFPILLKTAGGGGGIGLQIVHKPEDLDRAARTSSDRGKSAFGDERVYIERYVTSPRHIEVQVFCDGHGGAVALGERECSVQRRHQKIIEEALSPASFFQGDEGQRRRQRLYDSALRVVQAAGYRGAGTVEFIADADGNLWFLEVNARLQVEHPVTEMISGLDLVEWQIRVARGEPLPSLQPSLRGHSIEARLYAEDPAKKFAPQPGKLARLRWPDPADDLRIETGFEEGGDITPYYDPLIAKLVARGPDRASAIARLDRALASTELELVGPRGPASTNLAYLRTVLADPRFAGGSYDTSLAEAIASGK
ncbi:MAG: ATP-grasp domain-containing protein [Polyangiaceae bacterium]|jgi:acetyl-CoA carboxylase biotin carboxylase subunit/3-methylcrotonyl-CoA carboxylase alpha subunit|nr:ATP-grasp domain-containing protein [Polyangiaceae bacterium]